MSISASQKPNTYIFPRRVATEYGTTSPTPIDRVLHYLGTVSQLVLLKTTKGEFTPQPTLRIPLLSIGNIKEARRQTRNRGGIPYSNEELAAEVYTALPSTKGEDLTARFITARLIGNRTLTAQVDGSSGVSNEQHAARRRFVEMAGGKLTLPPIEHAAIPLGRFNETVPQGLIDDVLQRTNNMFKGKTFTFPRVQYGWSHDIAKGVFVPLP